MADYPKRERYFAHKFVRILQKSCAAQSIGRDATLLLCFIAHTEDAARYSGPVKFWNSQLYETMGFRSPKQLREARLKAIDAGWLVYLERGTRSVGEYYVTIPARCSGITDAPIFDLEDDILSAGDLNNGTNNGTNNGIRNGLEAERITVRERNESGLESGKPPIPIPKDTDPKGTNPNTNTPLIPQGGNGVDSETATKSSNVRKPKDAEPYSEDFERFWESCSPIRKTKKPDAWKAWQAAIKTTDPQTIIAAAIEYALSPQGLGEYCPGPGPWLRARRWEDDRTSWLGAKGAAEKLNPPVHW